MPLQLAADPLSSARHSVPCRDVAGTHRLRLPPRRAPRRFTRLSRASARSSARRRQAAGGAIDSDGDRRSSADGHASGRRGATTRPSFAAAMADVRPLRAESRIDAPAPAAQTTRQPVDEDAEALADPLRPRHRQRRLRHQRLDRIRRGRRRRPRPPHPAPPPARRVRVSGDDRSARHVGGGGARRGRALHHRRARRQVIARC